MSLRSRSHSKASMVLTRADHLYINNYVFTSKLYLNTYCNGPEQGLNPHPTVHVSDAFTN